MRGGKREGAGRPKQEQSRVRYTIRIKPETLKKIKLHNIKVGPIIDNIVRDLTE